MKASKGNNTPNGPKDKNDPKNKNKRIIFLIIGFIIVSIFINYIAYCGTNPFSNENIPQKVSYSKIVELLRNKQTESVEADAGNNTVILSTKDGATYTATIPSIEVLSEVIQTELDNGQVIDYNVKSSEKMNAADIFSLCFDLMLILYMFKMFSSLGNLGGNSKIEQAKSSTKFTDIAGLDEEIEEVKIVIDFLKNPDKFRKAGAKIPKGILLEGKPGTGKTLLAKAIAGEAGVPVFATTASSFEEKFVGVGAERVRKLFTEARKAAPCIIFIDEIDTLLLKRYNGSGYNEQTLNQFLSELDGFSDEDSIIVIGATNYSEVLDEAAVRAGRFDKKIYIPTPNEEAREKILEVHMRNKKKEDNVSLECLARRTAGFTGADMANILNQAVLLSIADGREGIIAQQDIDEALARILLGVGKKNALDAETRRRIALHEAGHAIISKLVNPDRKISEISIESRGKAGGYTLIESPDKILRTKRDLLSEIDCLLGGRAAEQLMFKGNISTGAENDLMQASKIAYGMVVRYGMTSLSQVTAIQGANSYNETLEKERFQEVEKIIKRELEDVVKELQTNEVQLQCLAERLQSKTKLDEDEISKFFGTTE